MATIENIQLTGVESTSNKAIDFSVVNDIKYPTVKAVQDQLDTKTDKGGYEGTAQDLKDLTDIYDSIISEREQTITALVNSKISRVDIDRSPITLTETDFEDLLIYEDRYYFVLGVGKYFGSILLEREPWVYGASDLHVSKTGNDTTGDGSYGNPYLTINHAFDQVASTGGIKIWVQAGIYAEDGGGGYFSTTRAAF